MKSSISIAIVALLGLTVASDVLADCAADSTVQETQQRYAKAQKLEAAGDLAGAFAAYVGAQDYTCDSNPVEAPAAARAAPLALKLGAAAEQSKNFEKAFQIYDDGGQYAAAERALMAWVRANPDNPSVFGRAREAFDYRASPAFAANNKARLAVTGAYQPNAQNIAEVQAMPAKGAERAFQKEAAAFNEEYLRGYVQQIQSRPDDPSDMAATQAWTNTHTVFLQRWQKSGDPLEISRDALSLVHSWSSATSDEALAAKIATRRNQVLEQRAATLAKTYAGAPEFLTAAIDYQMDVQADEAVKQSRAESIRTQANQLGDAANGKQRYILAAQYFRVAGQDAKAQAAQDAYQKSVMNRMQPQIDQMRQQAEQMQKEFSDPAKVDAMRQQALAMQKSLQEQQQANAKNKGKKADELEKELGL